MILITFCFPDEGPGGDSVTEDEVTKWGEMILKPMNSFTGMHVSILGVTTVTSEEETPS